VSPDVARSIDGGAHRDRWTLDWLRPGKRPIKTDPGSIVHVVDGFVSVECRDYRLRLPAGTTFICPPDETPRLTAFPGWSPQLLHIARRGRSNSASDPCAPTRFGIVPGVVFDDVHVEGAMSAVVLALSDCNTADLELEVAVRRATAALLAGQRRSRHLARHCSGRTRERRVEQYSRLARARAVLAWGDDPSIEVPRVAAIAHMSTSHFMAKFQRVFGCAPHQYRIERRMGQARRLLLDTTWSTMQIVHCIGIESTAAFARMFLRHFGLPLSTLRRGAPANELRGE